MRISAIVWRDSVSCISPTDTCSSARSDLRQRTCLVNDLASHENLKGNGGGAFSLFPQQHLSGSVPQTWPGAAHPSAPSPGESKCRLSDHPTTLATAKTIFLPWDSWGDRDLGVGGCLISGLPHRLQGCFLF